MTDIVEKLNNQAVGAEAGPSSHWTSPELLREAAAEIVRLREALAKEREAFTAYVEAVKNDAIEAAYNAAIRARGQE